MARKVKPRASKTTVKWQKKQQQEPVLDAVSVPIKKFQPSKHPVVQMMKQIEEQTPDVSADVKYAAIAGFRAAHCSPEKFNMTKEIARVRLPDGKMKKTYACDVCGFVGSKVTAT